MDTFLGYAYGSDGIRLSQYERADGSRYYGEDPVAAEPVTPPTTPPTNGPAAKITGSSVFDDLVAAGVDPVDAQNLIDTIGEDAAREAMALDAGGEAGSPFNAGFDDFGNMNWTIFNTPPPGTDDPGNILVNDNPLDMGLGGGQDQFPLDTRFTGPTQGPGGQGQTGQAPGGLPPPGPIDPNASAPGQVDWSNLMASPQNPFPPNTQPWAPWQPTAHRERSGSRCA